MFCIRGLFYLKSLKGYANLKVTSKCYVIYFLELKERPT